ncbi:MAG: acetyl-CoA carboxylase biotin carboxyl carrier protein subunit [Burkholderiaceae bacterium]|nr:acetyl-CoA carboxylase biotin carboxyl carrier protein subunit [Burkholderiaceae bacterium]
MAGLVVKSEVAGTVWKLEVAAGAAVVEGQSLVIVESMKMEIPVVAPRAGAVVRLLVVEGDAVAEGQDVVVLA